VTVCALVGGTAEYDEPEPPHPALATAQARAVIWITRAALLRRA
jgi:hypothetical protein